MRIGKRARAYARQACVALERNTRCDESSSSQRGTNASLNKSGLTDLGGDLDRAALVQLFEPVDQPVDTFARDHR